MRYYGFANFMLSSIQQGVQNFHVIHEMFVKYQVSSSGAARVLYDWAQSHKTAVFLNGGNAAGVRDVYKQLETFGQNLCLPYSCFYEDEQSLDNSMTACGIVVPTNIVDLVTALRASTTPWSSNLCYSDDEVALATFLTQFQHAR